MALGDITQYLLPGLQEALDQSLTLYKSGHTPLIPVLEVEALKFSDSLVDLQSLLPEVPLTCCLDIGWVSWGRFSSCATLLWP